MTTPVEVWAPAYLEFSPQELTNLKVSPKFSIKWLSNPANVFGLGNRCNLCETLNVTDREQHLKQHLRELKTFLSRPKPKTEEELAPPLAPPSVEFVTVVRGLGETHTPDLLDPNYYTHPCRVCGNSIPKTGKRGHPPVKCPSCR